MSWQRCGMVLVLSNAAVMILGCFLLRMQDYLPFDSLQRTAQTPLTEIGIGYRMRAPD